MMVAREWVPGEPVPPVVQLLAAEGLRAQLDPAERAPVGVPAPEGPRVGMPAQAGAVARLARVPWAVREVMLASVGTQAAAVLADAQAVPGWAGQVQPGPAGPAVPVAPLAIVQERCAAARAWTFNQIRTTAGRAA